MQANHILLLVAKRTLIVSLWGLMSTSGQAQLIDTGVGTLAARANHSAVQSAREYSSFIAYYDFAYSRDQTVDLSTELSQVEQATGLTLIHQRTLATGGELIITETPITASMSHNLLDAFKQSRHLTYIEPDVLMQPHFVPNDPRFPEQAHLTDPPEALMRPLLGIGLQDLASPLP